MTLILADAAERGSAVGLDIFKCKAESPKLTPRPCWLVFGNRVPKGYCGIQRREPRLQRWTLY